MIFQHLKEHRYPSVSFFQIREIDNDVLFRDMLMSWGLSDAGGGSGLFKIKNLPSSCFSPDKVGSGVSKLSPITLTGTLLPSLRPILKDGWVGNSGNARI